MANGIRTGDPRSFNKGRSSKFREGSRVRPKPEEGRRTYRRKPCGNNNKDEDNSSKTLRDKNQQGSSQKFRQQTPEEGRRTYRPKRCGNNNKDEDNSPKTFRDKNQQVSSQKFRQLTRPKFELANSNIAIQLVNHYPSGTPSPTFSPKIIWILKKYIYIYTEMKSDWLILTACYLVLDCFMPRR